MTRPPRRGRTPGRRDEGTTLVELLVVMVLTTVVLAAVSAVFTTATRSVRETESRTSSQADARTALEATTRALRVATTPAGGASAITRAAPTSVTFYASLQRTPVTTATASASAGASPAVHAVLQQPTLVTLRYDAGQHCVLQDQTPAVAAVVAAGAAPTYSWPASATVTTCLARTLTPPAFSYYTTGALMAPSGATAAPLDVSGAPLDASAGGTSLASLRSIASIGVVVSVTDPDTPQAGATVVQDRVTLANSSGANP